MNMNDLVSIITPSYNTAKFIAETIDSVRHQTYSNWEMIIVDDSSTDDTDTVVEGYFGDSRIKYFKNKKNFGAAVSRNKALQEAKGRWIAFLDSDDLWQPDKLEKQIQFMEDNDYHFSYTNYEEIDEESKPIGVHVTGPRKITKHDMYNYCWPGCLTVMYDRDMVGLINIKDIKKNNDYAMWLEVCQKVDCWILKNELAKYRKRSNSVSRHSIKTMIIWHYKLWHESQEKNVISSLWYTCWNLFFGFIKKIMYVTKDRR
jgi:glycosyltransferase involved in cell wall biosynthesis